MSNHFLICHKPGGSEPGRDYSNFRKGVEGLGHCWRHFDSTWIVATDETSSQMEERLIPLIFDGDSLLIIGVTNDCRGWLVLKERKALADVIGVAEERLEKSL